MNSVFATILSGLAAAFLGINIYILSGLSEQIKDNHVDMKLTVLLAETRSIDMLKRHEALECHGNLCVKIAEMLIRLGNIDTTLKAR